MKTTNRKADSQGRVTLYPDFGNRRLVMDRIGADEVRIRRAKAVPRRPALRELLNGINESNIHREADFGAPVGKEQV